MTDTDNRLSEFVKSRDAAFTAFVMEDDWDAVLRHMARYGQSIPSWMKEEIAKVGVLKSVQACTRIPDEVKHKAAVKCVEMGFTPFVFDI